MVLGRVNCTAGCLYDVVADPTETHELSAERPADKAALMARFVELAAGAFTPDRGSVDPRACQAALRYGGFWGPFAFLNASNAAGDVVT